MPRGGHRPGAGRPKGSKNSLPYGTVKAIREFNKQERAMAKLNIPKTPKGYRVPPDASPEAKEVADFAMDRLIAAAAGRVHPQKSTSVIKASVEIRKEICGPIAIKVEADVGGRLEKLLTASMEPDRPQLPGQVVDAQVLPEKDTTAQGAFAPQAVVPATAGSG